MTMIFAEECTFRHQGHNRSKNTKKIAGEWVIESCGTAIAFSIFGKRKSMYSTVTLYKELSLFGGSFLAKQFFARYRY